MKAYAAKTSQISGGEQRCWQCKELLNDPELQCLLMHTCGNLDLKLVRNLKSYGKIENGKQLWRLSVINTNEIPAKKKM
jgi:hypothetical protein